MSKPGGRHIETHAEQPELPVPLVARPPSSQRQVQPLEIHPAPVVAYPYLAVVGRAVPARQRDPDSRALADSGWVREEVVERVIDQLRQALPRGELDITEHRQQPRVGPNVDHVRRSYLLVTGQRHG